MQENLNIHIFCAFRQIPKK